MSTYIAEMTVATDAAGTTEVVRLAAGRYNTKPSDSPANTHYIPRLSQPGLVRRDMFASGRTSGASSVGYGELQIVNPDGVMDYLMPYAFDGRPLTIKFGDPDGAYSSFITVLAGTMEQADFDERVVSVRVKDKLFTLDNPLAKVLYAGNNVSPAGVEGTADTIKGQPKPLLFGSGYNITPVTVNAVRLIYQVHNGAVSDIPKVYDRGVELTRGADYATQADMDSVGGLPAAGTYRVYLAGGMFRVGSAPSLITCDAIQGASSADRTVAQVLKAIALQMGVAGGDISAADVTALDTANSAEVGVYVNDTATALNVMDQVAQSIGAWYGFDALGILRMGRLVAPSGTPVIELNTWNLVNEGGASVRRITPSDETNGLPTHRVTLKYQKNYTPQETDLAGAVTSERRAFLKEAFRSTVSEDAAILTQYLTATPVERETLLVDAGAAATEVARLLALFKVRRDTYEVDVRLDSEALQALDLGVVVSLTNPRFGLVSGKLMVVLGFQVDFQDNSAKLTLWG